MNKTKGLLALLTCAAIFGTFGILVRFLNTELSSYQQVFLRNVLSCLFAVVLALATRASWSFKDIRKKFILLYAIAFPLSNIFFTLSIINTKISLSTFSLYIGSLSVSILLGSIIFKEAITKKKIISILFLLCGLICFTYPFSFASVMNIGLLFGILSGASEGVANSLRKSLGGTINRFVLVAIQTFGGSLISYGLMTLASERALPTLSPFVFGMTIVFGILLMTISYLAIVGFSNFDLNLGTVVLSSELIFAPLFALIIFSESPTGYEWIGGLFIVLAIVIPNVRFKKKYLQ